MGVCQLWIREKDIGIIDEFIDVFIVDGVFPSVPIG
jgi:hypothetical protein